MFALSVPVPAIHRRLRECVAIIGRFARNFSFHKTNIPYTKCQQSPFVLHNSGAAKFGPKFRQITREHHTHFLSQYFIDSQWTTIEARSDRGKNVKSVKFRKHISHIYAHRVDQSNARLTACAYTPKWILSRNVGKCSTDNDTSLCRNVSHLFVTLSQSTPPPTNRRRLIGMSSRFSRYYSIS